MKPTETITKRETENFLASLPMISGLWDVLYTNVFLVLHLVILIVNKLTNYFFYVPLLPFICNFYAFTFSSLNIDAYNFILFCALLKILGENKLMIKPTKSMNFHLTIFHINPFVMGKIQTRFLPNNPKKARTKLTKQFENYIWT